VSYLTWHPKPQYTSCRPSRLFSMPQRPRTRLAACLGVPSRSWCSRTYLLSVLVFLVVLGVRGTRLWHPSVLFLIIPDALTRILLPVFVLLVVSDILVYVLPSVLVFVVVLGVLALSSVRFNVSVVLSTGCVCLVVRLSVPGRFCCSSHLSRPSHPSRPSCPCVRRARLAICLSVLGHSQHPLCCSSWCYWSSVLVFFGREGKGRERGCG